MTVQEFRALVVEIGRILGIEPIFSHGDEVAQLGEFDDIELHRSGIVRRTRWLDRSPDAKRIAESMRLEAADRRGPYMRKAI